MASAPAQPAQFHLEGGAKLHKAIADWSKQSMSLFTTLFMIILLTFAAYADQLPSSIRWQLSSTVGRLLMIIVLYIVYEIAGWIPALLFTIGILMIWSNRPLAYGQMTKPVEGFQGRCDKQAGQKRIKVQGSRWFVEEVLQENPVSIEEDRVYTQAVQEDTYSPNTRTSR